MLEDRRGYFRYAWNVQNPSINSKEIGNCATLYICHKRYKKSLVVKVKLMY